MTGTNLDHRHLVLEADNLTRVFGEGGTEAGRVVALDGFILK